MVGRRSDLLSQIERDAGDGRSDLAAVLRKCITLGGHARSAELRDWARRELDGYRGIDVPSYRQLDAPLLLDGLQGHWQIKRRQISVFDLPDFAQETMREGLTIPFGIAELERLAKKQKPIDLQPSGADDLVYYMNRSGNYAVQVERIYYSADPTSIHGIVDQIRTNLVALAAELRASGVAGDGIPTAAAADQAVQVVVKGFARANVAVGPNATASSTSNTSAGDGAAESRIPGWVRGPWGVAIGIGTILGGVAGATSVGWTPFG